MVSPQAKREVIQFLIDSKKLKPYRAYCLVGLRPSTFYYKKSSSRDDSKLKAKILEVAKQRVRWGCPRIYQIVRRDGFKDCPAFLLIRFLTQTFKRCFNSETLLKI